MAGVIILIFGLITIICSALNMDWMFSGSKGKFYVRAFGRNGARIVHYIIGTVISGCGLFAIFRS